ncbi:hypothetical protein [Endozoicomonas lisbonensis]
MKNNSVTPNEVDPTLLLKKQQSDNPSQKETPLSKRNVGDSNTTDQSSSVPAPPPPPPLRNKASSQIATPAPMDDTAAPSDSIPDAQQKAEVSDSVDENTSAETNRKTSKRGGIAKKIAHIFGELKRFITGTNFEKLPQTLLNDVKATAALLDEKNATTEKPSLFSSLDQELSEWNNKVDRLAQLKEDEGADSQERTELKKELKERKQKIASIASAAETLLEIKETEKRLQRDITQQIATPQQKELVKQLNETVTASSAEAPRPSSLAQELKAVKLKKAGSRPEQKSPEQTTTSSGGLILNQEMLTKARGNLKRKAEQSQPSQVTPDEPEFIKKRREIQGHNTDREE